MSILVKNPWGVADTGMEIQRNDMWSIHLSEIISTPTTSDTPPDNLISVLGSSLGSTNLVADDNLQFFAKSITFPDVRTGNEAFLSGDIWRSFPTYDEAIQSVRIVFTMDANDPVTYKSKILTILYRWRALCRVGRTGINQYTDLDNDSGKWKSGNGGNLLLETATSKPIYRFDIPIRMFVGNDADTPINGIYTSTKAKLRGAWLQAYQVSELTQDGTPNAVTVTATFYCDEITFESEPGMWQIPWQNSGGMMWGSLD